MSRRSGGRAAAETSAGARRLEEAVAGHPMEERLLQAAARVERAGEPAPIPAPLRAEQARVFTAFATYLEDLATRPRSAAAPPFCRIILPPRTGKTVIAGHIIDRTGLTATFIVPTRALVEQTVRELARRVPGVAIGTYCGERKLVARSGINVVTYAMLHLHAAELPPEIASSALVFVDEAHHAMTPGRMATLAHRFDPLAVRVALTATPDYGIERRLEHFFPELIHEILLTSRHEKPALDPAAAADIREVLASNPDFAPETCGVFRFAGLWFDHPLFVGRGDFLLRWLGVSLTREAYHRFIGRIFPEAAANLLLAQDGWHTAEHSCRDDLRRLRRALCAPSADARGDEPFVSTWRAVAGPAPGPYDSPEELCIARQTWDLVVSLLPRLRWRQRALVIGRFGRFGHPEQTFAELAARELISVERARRILDVALRKLRRWARLADVTAVDQEQASKDQHRRRANAAAAYARYLSELHARAPEVWRWLEKMVMSRSLPDQALAMQRLHELREAAGLAGALPAFQARLMELQASTSKRQTFWGRWSATEHLRPRGTDVEI